MSEERPSKDVIAGAVGGLFNVVTGHPLDTIKVRLQAMPHVYKGTWNTTKKLVLQEGPFSLYKGITAPLVTVVPIFAIGFLSFGLGKELVSEPDQETLTGKQLFLAGMFSGGCTSLISAPAERIKCLLQVQPELLKAKGPKKYNGLMDCAIKLWKEGGIRNLYLGTCATLLRDLPSTGFFFFSYDLILRNLTKQSEKVTPWQSLIAGGCAGTLNWMVALPIDTVKSKLQTSALGRYPHGFRSAFFEVVEKDGLLALYHGIVPVLLRAFPANAAFFMGIEMTKNILNEYAPWI
ncbi:congested-like trachea protein [Colletes gigas]|uniref:congested-like trachea protein n=1 Tax=Colletes gigas TaxID=935657 RepID=UPI001C9B90FF|nr:congested-like trachea protein [Colletes gigas]